ncbi:MAG: hypothetical protein ACT4NY_14915 [Pseudonocardiales bacterium]
MTALDRVRTALSAVKDPAHDLTNLADGIEAFTAERLTLPS